ncbi:MAG TPA: chemotaxis protein CheA [Steroidobacteraceae bacterium]|nr:chemotaxis protein CheA [Steroidobacteraceae bacterium]
MSLEMEQFHAGFFEESFESLDGMENSLLQLDPNTPNAEAINSVFRVAHSIKGGSGMFSFTAVASFTHTLETLLDELRAGRMAVTRPIIDLLLKSTDVLRGMLKATQSKAPIDQQTVADVQFDLELMLANRAPPTGATGATPASPTPAAEPTSSALPDSLRPKERTWTIEFRPNARLAAPGADPSRVFAELAELGTMALVAHAENLPALAELDPESCYLTWTITLTTELPSEAIRNILDWAEADCELREEEPSAARPHIALVPLPTPPSPLPSPPPPSSPQTIQGPAGEPTSNPAKATPAESNSIRVATEKLDQLMNTLGEIVIAQSMLMQLVDGTEPPRLERISAGLIQLERNVRDLQESVMRVRMLPIRIAFSRFPRLVHDLSARLNKQIELKMTGEQTELDKTVLEKIGDPLVHLVRNSIDHGLELPEIRLAAGKSPVGTLFLNAYHRGGSIVIEVGDDGAGLNLDRILSKARAKGLVGQNDALSDEAVANLIFQPGFSTAEVTTELSGRGVGMDVVRRNIEELGGTVELRTEAGKGSSVVISLPLTLAIVDGLSVGVGGEVYIVPLLSIIASLQFKRGEARGLTGVGEVFLFRGEYIPIIRLHDAFNLEPRCRDLELGSVMVVECDGRRVGLFVDELLGQQQVVVKSMETNYHRIEGVSGATILGDGSVALILDIPSLVRYAAERCAA